MVFLLMHDVVVNTYGRVGVAAHAFEDYYEIVIFFFLRAAKELGGKLSDALDVFCECHAMFLSQKDTV